MVNFRFSGIMECIAGLGPKMDFFVACGAVLIIWLCSRTYLAVIFLSFNGQAYKLLLTCGGVQYIKYIVDARSDYVVWHEFGKNLNSLRLKANLLHSMQMGRSESIESKRSVPLIFAREILFLDTITVVKSDTQLKWRISTSCNQFIRISLPNVFIQWLIPEWIWCKFITCWNEEWKKSSGIEH